MNKKILLLITISVITVYTFAQAPDMEFFAPTEYMYMTELKDSERDAAIKNTPLLIEKAEHINSYFLDGREYPEQQILYDKIRVFSEILNSEMYTWFLIPITRSDRQKFAFKNVTWVPEYQYILGLTKSENGKDTLLFMGPTCYEMTREASGERYMIDTYQIIKAKNRNKGIMYYHNELTFYWQSDAGQNYIFKKTRNVKGQPEGYVVAYYYMFDEQPKQRVLEASLSGFTYPKGWDYIQIDASAFLWDLKKPLKYGLQNAFDGNPATSFVENTEDDLMKINVWLGKPTDKMAIINGYAANQKLYSFNNRIKEIGGYFQLSDSVLDYQFIPCRSTNIPFTAKYNGEKYNDTCLAELNFYYEGEWLFGDLDE